jgi:hypothetical protein
MASFSIVRRAENPEDRLRKQETEAYNGFAMACKALSGGGRTPIKQRKSSVFMKVNDMVGFASLKRVTFVPQT